MKRALYACARAAARRPLPVLALAVVLALGGAALALRLRPTAGTDTLVGRSSPSFQATQRYNQAFGQDAVVVLVRGSLQRSLLTEDLARLIALEGCLAGKDKGAALARLGGARGPCGALSREQPAKVVIGPASYINTATAVLDDQLAAQTQQTVRQEDAYGQLVFNAARKRGVSVAQSNKLAREARAAVAARYVQSLVRVAVDYGITSQPAINDPDWVSKLAFDPLDPPGTPKQRLAYILPSRNAALISVRLKPNLNETQQTHAIALIKQAVALPALQLAHGERYLVTGVPVVISDLTKSITSSVKWLLLAALLVMAATLSVVFRVRLRLLPLAIALLATALTFGALSLSGASLTIASIGVLPVLIGLAVDYAIQFQSRVDARLPAGSPAAAAAGPGGAPGAGGGGGAAGAGGGGGAAGAGGAAGPAGADGADVEERIGRAAAAGGPTIVTAAAATAGGFLALALSPVPMVREFGYLLVVGVVLALLCAFTAGAAVIGLADRRTFQLPAALTRAPRALWSWLAPAWRGAGELLFDNRPLRRLRVRAPQAAAGALAYAVARPGRVLACALVLAAAGWALDTQTRVETDIQKLVPQNLPALANLRALEQASGIGGEIDVTVRAADLTQPAVVRWMTTYQSRLLTRFGYTPTRGCGKAVLCPAFSLPDLFSCQTSPSACGSSLTADSIRGLLAAVPPYFSQGVITSDHRIANLAFGIRLMPLDRQQAVVQAMRAALHPPPGVHAELAGITVLAAQANAQVSPAWRRLVTLLAGLAAVALVLLIALRDRRRALVPLVPIVLATGWSALVLFAIRIPLNPMSVTLGALVIAISTEFSVLLAERFRQERLAGFDVPAALERTYSSTGRAVLASGVTAIAGFAALTASDIAMLRNFGIVTVVDLLIALVGVLLVLPAALALSERAGLAATRGRPLRARLRPRLGLRAPLAGHEQG